MDANKPRYAAEPARASVQYQAISPQRILVVEDDGDIRRLNTDVLMLFGYEVDAVEDGAVAWCNLQLNSYDLMITDNDMPRVSGVDLLKKLRAARMVLPVIMATGAVPEDDFTRHPWLKPAATLLKPYTVEQLLGIVKEVLYAADNAREQIAPPPEWRIQPVAVGSRV